MSREQNRSAGPRPDDPNERDAINQVLEDEPELAPILEAMVATLEEESLPAGGWEALRAKLDSPESERGRQTPTSNATMPPPTRAAPSTAGRWVVAMVLIAAVALAGSWGALKAGEAAKLRDDQRILAYWMANPGMRLVALSEPAAAPGSSARLGIVCVLPDGRALLLQPATAPRGASYVVVGHVSGRAQELARGRTNLLQFDSTGVSTVEVWLARGEEPTAVIATATIN